VALLFVEPEIGDKKMKNIVVEMNKIVPKRETALIGRENGENALEKLKKEGTDLCLLEKEYDKIIISVPEHVVSINRSYFLGMFETSIERLGKTGFLLKYEFKASDHIRKKVKDLVESAVSSASQEDILNAYNMSIQSIIHHLRSCERESPRL